MFTKKETDVIKPEHDARDSAAAPASLDWHDIVMSGADSKKIESLALAQLTGLKCSPGEGR
ncbi:hypothetical protein A8B82_18990 [Sulfitobacter sp. EhC04]|nr:hypothetical protein A8B82_18990 [Sulfitobacter sp. EhC04]